MEKGKLAIRRFGKRLKQLRTAKRWSQQELASKIFVEQSYISDIERGIFGPSFSKLSKIADALNMTISELCEGI